MDQTNFNDSPDVLDSTSKPPKSKPPITDSDLELAEIPESGNRRKFLLFGVMGVAITLILIAIALVLISPRGGGSGNGLGNQNPTPSPAPTGEPTEFTDELEVLEDQILDSDPSPIDLAPPPLNFNLEL